MYSRTKTLDPDVLIAFIGKEFDCQNSMCATMVEKKRMIPMTR